MSGAVPQAIIDRNVRGMAIGGAIFAGEVYKDEDLEFEIVEPPRQVEGEAQKASDTVIKFIRIQGAKVTVVKKYAEEEPIPTPAPIAAAPLAIDIAPEGKPQETPQAQSNPEPEKTDPEVEGEDAGDKAFVKEVMGKRADAQDQAVYNQSAMAASVRNRNRPIYVKHVGIGASTGCVVGAVVGGAIGAGGGPIAPATVAGCATVGAVVGAGVGGLIGLGVAEYRIRCVYEQNFRIWSEGQTRAAHTDFVMKFQKCQVLQVCYDKHFQRIITFPAIDRCGHIFDAEAAEVYVARNGTCPINHSTPMARNDLKVCSFQFGQMEAALEVVLTDKTTDVEFSDRELAGLRAFKTDLDDKCDKFFKNEEDKLNEEVRTRRITERQKRVSILESSGQYAAGRKSVIKV